MFNEWQREGGERVKMVGGEASRKLRPDHKGLVDQGEDLAFTK